MNLPLLFHTVAALCANPAPTDATLPSFEHHTLPNGLEVVFFESRSSPWLEVQLVFRAGTAADPDGRSGLAALTADAMMAGTKTLGESELSDHLAVLGAALDVDAGRHQFAVSGAVPTFDPAAVATFMTLLADVALRPAFDERLIARDRGLRIANVRRLVGRHGALADTAIRHAVFGDGPDARADFGRLADLERITRDDVAAFHRRVTSPSHAVLLIGGSFQKQPMLDWITTHLGPTAWPATAVRCEPGAFTGHCAQLCDDSGCLANPSALPRPDSTPGPRRLLVTIDDENLTQVQWRMGFATPFAVMAPDYGPLRMAFHLLGGDFTARLNQVLRAREGLTYGAYASADFGAHRPDLATIRTDAPPDTLTRAIELTRGIITAMRTEPVPAAELDENRAALKNGFAFRFEAIPDTLAQLRYLFGHRLAPTWLAQWATTVTSPDAAAIQAAFARHVPADGGHLVVVGPAALLPRLKAMEPGESWHTVSASDLLGDGLARATPATAP
jgi:zinc protease